MPRPRSRSTAERRYGELVQKLNCPPSLKKRLCRTLVGRSHCDDARSDEYVDVTVSGQLLLKML